MASSVPEIVTPEDLAYFRALAESRMNSVTDVRRKGPNTTGGDGLKVPSWPSVVTDAPFRLAGNRGPSQYRTVTIGSTDVQLAIRVGHWPIALMGTFRDGDVVEITAGDNAGRFLTIVESLGKDQANDLQLPVVEREKPDGWPT
jgi:hypothetical protein